jgi:hypothetical protein
LVLIICCKPGCSNYYEADSVYHRRCPDCEREEKMRAERVKENPEVPIPNEIPLDEAKSYHELSKSEKLSRYKEDWWRQHKVVKRE